MSQNMLIGIIVSILGLVALLSGTALVIALVDKCWQERAGSIGIAFVGSMLILIFIFYLL